MPRKSETRDSAQPGLFEQGHPGIDLPPATSRELVTFVEALLLEIAAALATQEVSDDQDRR